MPVANRLKWQTTRTVAIAGHHIPCADEIAISAHGAESIGHAQTAGVRADTALNAKLKTVAWPLYELRSKWLCDGFIERWAGRQIRRLVDSGTTMIEIGCGRGRLVDYLPAGVPYNGFDIAFSEFQLRRLLKNRPSVNIALIDCKAIPLPPKCADLLVSTEVFEHIPGVESAISELIRVARPGAHLVCSIPNNYARKYEVKGPHPDHVNSWTFHEFKDLMADLGWSCQMSTMIGRWIPVGTHTSYQLPLTSKHEKLNTNFLYVFRAVG